MSGQNKLLYSVGLTNDLGEKSKHLLASQVIQAKLDVEDVSLSREERREAKTYLLEGEGKYIIEQLIERTIPIEMLVTC